MILKFKISVGGTLCEMRNILVCTVVQQTVMSVGAGAIHDLLSCCIACTLLIDCVCLKILTA
jgi:hypothetical protein